ncbi:major facilitator superfamily domain-containing protein [Mycena galericulata]|nr:major facilitator superfamily domain-containing protein [Mycena galericulata]
MSLPDGLTDEDFAEPFADSHDGHVMEEEGAHAARQKMPWWKRPAPWWLMVLGTFSSIIMTATLAPTVELYTKLACRVHTTDPNYPKETYNGLDLLPNTSLVNLPPSFSTVVVDDVLIRRNTETVYFEETSECVSDPVVQAAVAKLITAITISTGVLTFLTVGWWGSFSDRHGRTRMISIAACGQALATLNMVFVAKNVQRIPGGYWFLVVGAAIVGVLGGSASETAAGMAYVADVSTSAKRSHMFSLMSGFWLVGIGIGPTLGSLIVRLTHNFLSVFYVAATFRIIQACLLLFIVPESLTSGQMHRASARKREESLPSDERTPLLWLQFLKPLLVLWPDKTPKENPVNDEKRDWNLPILAAAYGVTLLAMSSLASQFLYALSTFRWDSEYLGYAISSMGVSRAAYLILILPIAIKYFKNGPQNDTVGANLSESEPLLSISDHDTSSTPKPRAHASTFDLALARFSILVEIAVYALLPFAPTGLVFILFAMFGALASGLGPAVHGVALELYTRQLGDNAVVESGKLFGALGVVEAVFGHVLGPSMYGSIYAATVGTYPRAIFFVAVGNGVVGLVLLAFVKLPREKAVPDVENPVDQR